MENTNKYGFIYIPSLDAAVGKDAGRKNYRLSNGVQWRFWAEDFLPAEYRHPYFLVTAGQSYKKMDHSAKYGFTSDTLILGDSGGYQISKGTLEWDLSLREKIFHWLEENSTVAMNLDIPTRNRWDGKFYECLDISADNFKWFADHQTGRTDFLNIIQGPTYEKYSYWYKKIKGMPFKGWAVGGAAGSVSSFFAAVSVLIENGELLNPEHKWLHILGCSSIHEFLLLAQLQKSLEEIGSKTQVMSDSSTPSLASAMGFYYLGYDFAKLSFSYLKFGREIDPMCRLDNLPVTTWIDRQIWEDYPFRTEFMQWKTIHYAWLVFRNFYIFHQAAQNSNDLVYGNRSYLQQAVKSEFYDILESLDKLVKSGADAGRLLHTMIPYAEKFDRKTNSNQVNPNPDFF